MSKHEPVLGHLSNCKKVFLRRKSIAVGRLLWSGGKRISEGRCFYGSIFSSFRVIFHQWLKSQTVKTNGSSIGSQLMLPVGCKASLFIDRAMNCPWCNLPSSNLSTCHWHIDFSSLCPKTQLANNPTICLLEMVMALSFLFLNAPCCTQSIGTVIYCLPYFSIIMRNSDGY